MSGHTPGPWSLSDDAVRRVIKGAGAKPRTVCIIESWTREPDARLIAAAPALLDALKELLAEAEAFEENGDRWDKERNDRARAALKQAGAL